MSRPTGVRTASPREPSDETVARELVRAYRELDDDDIWPGLLHLPSAIAIVRAVNAARERAKEATRGQVD